jgi:immune inhibitor A
MTEIAVNMPGFTGLSDGWVQKTFDLQEYVGQSILLQFRYMTDWGTTMAGFYVDDISVTADGTALFTDTVETLDPAWEVAGWTQEMGSGTKTHYYMLELRNTNPMESSYGETTIVNFDNGLSNVYQFDPEAAHPDEPYFFAYQPGVLLWYRDLTYTDNWTGVHPGGGFLLIVDAHKQALLRPPTMKYGSLPWTTRVQSYDAAFGLDRLPSFTLGYWGVERDITATNAVPTFADSLSYWSSKAPAASVQTPTYGFQFRVLGKASDGSAVVIGLGKK